MQETAIHYPQRLQRAARIARYGTVFLLMAMFVGTHIPSHGLSSFSVSDKVLHFAAYMTLTVSVLISWEFSIGILRPTHYFTVWLFGTIYGAFDEITQIPVGRSCDELDWLADILGIVVGLTLFRVFRPLLYRWF